MTRILVLLSTAVLVSACATLDRDDEPGRQAPAPAASTAQTAAGEETAPDEEAAATEPMQIVGSLTYDQKIPLPVDGDVRIALWEEGLADRPGEPVQSETFGLNGRQIPLPFEIGMPDPEAISASTLRLDVSIMDASGTLLWSNGDGTVFTSQAGLVELGAVSLYPEPAAVVDMTQLTGSDWMIARLDGEPLLQTTRATIRFDGSGKITGNASCNAFTGSFKLSAGRLVVAPLAMTRKACVPQLMAQEQTIISVLQTVSHVRIDETGLLILQNDEGGRITARQGTS